MRKDGAVQDHAGRTLDRAVPLPGTADTSAAGRTPLRLTSGRHESDPDSCNACDTAPLTSVLGATLGAKLESATISLPQYRGDEGAGAPQWKYLTIRSPAISTACLTEKRQTRQVIGTDGYSCLLDII
jgi:hypothetical protein